MTQVWLATHFDEDKQQLEKYLSSKNITVEKITNQVPMHSFSLQVMVKMQHIVQFV